MAGNMKVADILSDLTSLQVCDPAAAFALVSTRSNGSGAAPTSSSTSKDDDDIDLKRAKDLLELHANVKVAHQDGTDKDLNDAREDVARAMRSV